MYLKKKLLTFILYYSKFELNFDKFDLVILNNTFLEAIFSPFNFELSSLYSTPLNMQVYLIMS